MVRAIRKFFDELNRTDQSVVASRASALSCTGQGRIFVHAEFLQEIA
jgi:hypothetical protein